MSHQWPAETAFRRVELNVEHPACPFCQHHMHVCAHRRRRLFTLSEPWRLVLRVVQCPEPTCAGHQRTWSSEQELSIAMPKWAIGWDVFTWIGHRRLARHWSVPQICGELRDSYAIDLSWDAVEKYIRRYQCMLAARHQDLELLRAEYAGVDAVHLTIDGLQPEKGHETLYVVRELLRKRVWFAEPLVSSSEAEVRQLFVRAREQAQALGKSVAVWMSDKQEAFVQGVAAEFPGVPHRYCQNHFLRDLAQPVLEQDSHAKVQMRAKVRGLRAIERQVLDQQRKERELAAEPTTTASESTALAELPDELPQSGEVRRVEAVSSPAGDAAGGVVLDYCAAVRGILNDDQGGPFRPPGLRMAEALTEVRDSLQRNLESKKGGALRSNWPAWRDASTAAWPRSK